MDSGADRRGGHGQNQKPVDVLQSAPPAAPRGLRPADAQALRRGLSRLSLSSGLPQRGQVQKLFHVGRGEIVTSAWTFPVPRGSGYEPAACLITVDRRAGLRVGGWRPEELEPKLLLMLGPELEEAFQRYGPFVPGGEATALGGGSG